MDRVRRSCAVLAAVLACMLAPVAVVAWWAADLVGDTDAWVATVAPLAHDPVVERAVTTRVGEEVVERIDVPGLTRRLVDGLERRGLPPRAGEALTSLAAPLAGQVETFVHEHVADLVGSEAFADAWEEANREAHTQLVAALSGESEGTVRVEGTAVRLDLAVVVDAVRQRLVDAGFERAADLPPVTAEFTVLESADVPRLQALFRILTATAVVLPLVVAGLLLVALACSEGRRAALVRMSVALALAMLALVGLLRAAEERYLATTTADPQAAEVVIDRLLSEPRTTAWVVLGGALCVAVGAALLGRRPRDPRQPVVGAASGPSAF